MTNSFNTEAFTLLGVGVFLIGLRTIARIKSATICGLAADDYLMLLATLVYGLETGAAYYVGARFKGLANNSMTPEQRATLSPDSKEYHLRVGGSQLQLIGWSLYTLLLWTLKTCVCIYYSRMTAGLVHMKMRVRIGFALIFATYATTILSILSACGAPFKKNWQINPDPGNHCQPAVSHINVFVTLILNVLTDAYLLSIPIPLLWKSQISTKQKALLMVLFSGATFVMIAGILRCVHILLAGPNGAEQAGSWAVRETFVAVVVSNMPVIYSLFRTFFKSISKYHSKRFEVKSSDNVRMDDVNGSLKRHRRAGRSRDLASAYPVASSSLEHIIQEGDLESKSHWDRHTDFQGSATKIGPLSSTPLGVRDGDNRSNRIIVATRTTVESEPAPQTLGKDTRGGGVPY